ncbi:MAG: N-acetylmuramoyl-L-alanine amidase [Acidimicrobiia bacterium]
MERWWPRVAGALAGGLLLVAGCSDPARPGPSGEATGTTAAEPDRPPARAVVPAMPVVDPPTSVLVGRRICVDPGHDAHWAVGATGYDSRGRVPVHPTAGVPLYEYELTLKVGYRLASLLQERGADVCITRKEDGTMQIEPYDFTGDGRVRTDGKALEDAPERLQPRIDWANRFGAEVLVSVHFNGAGDPSVRGTEVYYSDTGPREERGRLLAESLRRGVLDGLRDSGYVTIDRGVHSDRYGRYTPEVRSRSLRNNAAAIVANGADPARCADCLRLGVLGNNPMSLQMGTYVGALVELEYLSSPQAVETFLLRGDSIDVMAAALADGLVAYFGGP